MTRAGCLPCLFCICPKSLYSCGVSGVFCVRRNPRRNRRNPAFGSGGARRYRSPLRLTEKGRDACRTIGGRIDAIVAEASAGLGAEERAVMYRALGTIGSRLEQIYDNRKQSRENAAVDGGK